VIAYAPSGYVLADADRHCLRQKNGWKKRARLYAAGFLLDVRPEVHDEFRKVKGSWQRTMDTLHRAHDAGLSVQVNTTVAKHNADILHEMVPFIQEVQAVQWSVFFLVPTGRAMAEQMVSAQEHERIFNWLYDLAQTAPFDIKATAAPMYRRVAIERKRLQSEALVTFQSAAFNMPTASTGPPRE
jgi:MoaA/NifB/PqqE/SkfB family radical SAM enzyme